MLDFNLTNFSMDTSTSCFTSDGWSKRCLVNLLCPQINAWMINAGIIVCAIYIISGWMLWVWWNHIYIHIDWDSFYMKHPRLMEPAIIAAGRFRFSLPYFGDLRRPTRKLYWDNFIRDKASKLLFGYAVVVLYFAIGH